MSKVKSKIRKGKQGGREEEEPEQGTDLLCCVPGGQGTVDVSFHILIARQLLKVIQIYVQFKGTLS